MLASVWVRGKSEHIRVLFRKAMRNVHERECNLETLATFFKPLRVLYLRRNCAINVDCLKALALLVQRSVKCFSCDDPLGPF